MSPKEAFGKRLSPLSEATSSTEPVLELRTETQAWTLPRAKSNPAVKEHNEREIDNLVANLLLAVDGHEGGPEELNRVADELEVLEPRYAATAGAAAARSRLIRQWARAIGENRGLAFSGDRGEVVLYDPALHEGDREFDISARVRIKTPAVLKRSADRSATVILKAFVEEP